MSIQNKNCILAALPEDQYQRILPHLEPFEFSHGRILYEIDGPIDYMYFPFGSMVSLVTQMLDGKIVEVGLVGKDGLTGLSALFGKNRSAERAIVQIPDGGMRLPATVVKQEFALGGGLQKSVLEYANDLMRQISQTAACNASHTVEERLSRWLLMCHDRIESEQLNLTQEFISEMLGTRRATVNVAALTLQSANLIRYSRGHITIKDRPGLEEFSCECYAALKDAIDGHETQGTPPE
ncbi:MAG TPA: Crp/Fnr family transcriptional regulator [Pyrinomonadaceae bacterium]|nr:Crp/Fnr family transcriptional regulator [Pyrinomonadaceae bacterium]